jgi:peptidyl-prolyl cis-trans isomerase B (cyclophilin B)
MTMLAVILLALQAAPVRLEIDSAEKVLQPGKRMPLRFTIGNAGDKEAKVEEPESYLEGLEIQDADGKVLRAAGKPAIADDREGWHKFRWSFGDAVSSEIRVWVMRDWIAKLETNHGDIEMEFYPAVAPNHVQNFLKLARSGFYEGSTFHRVVAGFMMQAGIPRDPAREIRTPLNAEFSAVKHVFGTVSMARAPTGPNTATSQFFICFGGRPDLDGNYTVFGQVIAGEDAVKSVERVKTDHSPCKKCGRVTRTPATTTCCGTHHEDRPEQDVVIKKVTVTERKK